MTPRGIGCRGVVTAHNAEGVASALARKMPEVAAVHGWALAVILRDGVTHILTKVKR